MFQDGSVIAIMHGIPNHLGNRTGGGDSTKETELEGRRTLGGCYGRPVLGGTAGEERKKGGTAGGRMGTSRE